MTPEPLRPWWYELGRLAATLAALLAWAIVLSILGVVFVPWVAEVARAWWRR